MSEQKAKLNKNLEDTIENLRGCNRAASKQKEALEFTEKIDALRQECDEYKEKAKKETDDMAAELDQLAERQRNIASSIQLQETEKKNLESQLATLKKESFELEAEQTKARAKFEEDKAIA